MQSDPETAAVAQQLASALDALTTLAFNRDLFPEQVKAAFEALDAHTALLEDCSVE